MNNMISESFAAPDSGGVVHRFEFHGNASEFFKIWAVNTALTVLTLGIFSAWAKVRTNRYFYANTFLSDANFEYHARPLSILFARIIVVSVIMGGAYLTTVNELFARAYSLLLLVFLPWALARGLAFNARNTSYRNVRFFSPSGGYVPYLFYVLTFLFVGVFLLPWLTRSYHRFKVERHQLGNTCFVFSPPPAAPYIGTLWLLPIFGGATLAALGAAARFAPGLPLLSSDFFLVVLVTVVIVVIAVFIQAALFRLFWHNIKTENGAAIRCNFSALQFAFLLLINLVATLLSLGLLHPWAKVRKARFLTERMHVAAPSGAMDNISERRDKEESPLGEEF